MVVIAITTALNTDSRVSGRSKQALDAAALVLTSHADASLISEVWRFRMNFVRTYAVTIYGMLVLALIIGGSVARIQYDSGVHGLLYHFVLIPVLGFMFYVPYELFRDLVSSGIVGLSFCGIVDYIRFRRRTKSRKSAL